MVSLEDNLNDSENKLERERHAIENLSDELMAYKDDQNIYSSHTKETGRPENIRRKSIMDIMNQVENLTDLGRADETQILKYRTRSSISLNQGDAQISAKMKGLLTKREPNKHKNAKGVCARHTHSASPERLPFIRSTSSNRRSYKHSRRCSSVHNDSSGVALGKD